VNKLVNLASRTAGFIHKRFGGQLGPQLDTPALVEQFVNAQQRIADSYEQGEYNRLIREVMSLADEANRYVDEQAPWVMAKQEEQEQQLHAVCTTAINLFRLLMLYLKPILPSLASRAETFLNTELSWQTHATPLLNHTL